MPALYQFDDFSIFVDGVNGDDSNSGLTESQAKFTLSAAKSAAAAGDMIFVGPGTYDEKDLLKNGVNWVFAPGAKVIYTGSSPTNPSGGIWDDSSDGANGAVVSKILGHGWFQMTDGFNRTQTIRVSNGNSRIYIECDYVGQTGATADEDVWVGLGILELHASYLESLNDCIRVSGGRLLGHVEQLIGGSTVWQIDDGHTDMSFRYAQAADGALGSAGTLVLRDGFVRGTAGSAIKNETGDTSIQLMNVSATGIDYDIFGPACANATCIYRPELSVDVVCSGVNVTAFNNLTLLDGYTPAEAMAIILAVSSGKISGSQNNAPVIRSANDTINRITAAIDEFGNRTGVTINVSGLS